jgi:hypothetical protein
VVEGGSDRSIRMDTETSPRNRGAGNLDDGAIRKRVGLNHSISCNCHKPYFAVAFVSSPTILWTYSSSGTDSLPGERTRHFEDASQAHTPGRLNLPQHVSCTPHKIMWLSWMDNRTLFACQILMTMVYSIAFLGMRRMYRHLLGTGSFALGFFSGFLGCVLLVIRGSVPYVAAIVR